MAFFLHDILHLREGYCARNWGREYTESLVAKRGHSNNIHRSNWTTAAVNMSAEDIVKLLNDGPEALSDPEVRAIVENYFYEVTDGKLNLTTYYNIIIVIIIKSNIIIIIKS